MPGSAPFPFQMSIDSNDFPSRSSVGKQVPSGRQKLYLSVPATVCPFFIRVSFLSLHVFGMHHCLRAQCPRQMLNIQWAKGCCSHIPVNNLNQSPVEGVLVLFLFPFLSDKRWQFKWKWWQEGKNKWNKMWLQLEYYAYIFFFIYKNYNREWALRKVCCWQLHKSVNVDRYSKSISFHMRYWLSYNCHGSLFFISIFKASFCMLFCSVIIHNCVIYS